MQGNDNTPAPDADGADDGVGIDPVENKSVKKAPTHQNTDSNPDRV